MKLTEQQMTRAVLVAEDEYNTRQLIEKIAPLVQFPWGPPSLKELEQIRHIYMHTTGNPDYNDWATAVGSFVRQRNAALLPPPVDSRREKIVAILGEYVPYRPALINVAADAVLAFLDNTQSR